MPTIGRPRVDERGPAVGDLPALDLDRGDLDEVGHLGVRAGRLDVDDDERVTGVDGLGEGQDRARAGLEERRALGLADGLLELELDVDERLQGAMAEQDRLGHDVFGQELGAGLDHHDRVTGTGHDEVEFGVGQFAEGRVDHELAADATDAHGTDRPIRPLFPEGYKDDIQLVITVLSTDQENEADVMGTCLLYTSPSPRD